jgi:polyphosphate kinase
MDEVSSAVEAPAPPVCGAAAAPPPSLDDPALFLHPLLSLLEFNRRVLAQGEDRSLPLLERLRFLTIFSTNLDEFFEVRVSGLKQQVRFGINTRGPDGLSPQQALQRIAATAHDLVAHGTTGRRPNTAG